MNSKASVSEKLIGKSLLPLFSRMKAPCISILIYHRILEEEDFLRPGDPTIAEFGWQMRLLREYFEPISLEQAVEAIRNNEIPQRAVCVTFDDGYQDNLTLGLEILEKYEIPSTIFVSTAYSDGGMMWNDVVIESVRNSSKKEIDLRSVGLSKYPAKSAEQKSSAVNAILSEIKYTHVDQRQTIVDFLLEHGCPVTYDLMLNSDQISCLGEKGIEIGGHTHNHFILSQLGNDQAYEEIRRNKEILESLLGKKLKFFAYPNGKYEKDYGSEHSKMVSDLGYAAAVATDHGVSRADADLWSLPRFTPWDKSPERFCFRLMQNYFA